MPNYRRLWRAGGTYFFTVNALQRQNNDIFIRHINLLRFAVAKIRREYPFRIHAWVVLPEHIHCIMELPPDDSRFDLRWQLIKTAFSKQLPKNEYRSTTRQNRNERGIWQRRYWEHLIRDDEDYKNHIDYIHFNPVHHRLVENVRDWQYSTFPLYEKQGMLPANWSGGNAHKIKCPEDWK